jgi:hypothetical protein
MKIDFHDIEDLGRLICGINEDDDSTDVDEALYEKFEISFDSFAKLIEKLIDYTPRAESTLSNKVFTGFVNGNHFVVKKEVEDEKEES